MRAIVFYTHGGPEVIEFREDIPAPQAGPGEVLVRVHYAALNRLDDFVRAGWRGPWPGQRGAQDQLAAGE